MPRPILAACTLALISATAALANEGAPLNDLTACRLSPEEVSVNFSFDGSACVKDQPALVGEADTGTLAITISLTETSDVCTMNIVPVKVSQTVAADENATAVQIAVLDPKGNSIAAGETAITPAGEGCSADISGKQ